MSFNIIPPQVPFVGSDGRIAREWYLFLVNLFQSNGSGQNAVTQDAFETMMLAATRGTNTSALEAALRDLAATLNLQRSERSAIVALERRVLELETQDRTARAPIGVDPRAVADLQTFAFGSRPWL